MPTGKEMSVLGVVQWLHQATRVIMFYFSNAIANFKMVQLPLMYRV